MSFRGEISISRITFGYVTYSACPEELGGRVNDGGAVERTSEEDGRRAALANSIIISKNRQSKKLIALFISSKAESLGLPDRQSSKPIAQEHQKRRNIYNDFCVIAACLGDVATAMVLPSDSIVGIRRASWKSSGKRSCEVMWNWRMASISASFCTILSGVSRTAAANSTRACSTT